MRQIAHILFATLLTLATGSAVAQYSGQSVRFSRRSLNMPAATLRVDGDLTMVGQPDPLDNLFHLTGGVAVAFTDDLELGATLMPIRLSPDGEYLNPSIYGMYSLLRGDIEASFQGFINLPVNNGFLIGGGLPVLLRVGDLIRINSGAWLSFYFSDAADTQALEVPIQVAIQPSTQFFIGPELGICVGATGRSIMTPQTANTCLFTPPAKLDQETYVPFGAFGGYTFVGDNLSPIGDWRFGLRSLNLSDGFDYWTIYTAFNLFLYL